MRRTLFLLAALMLAKLLAAQVIPNADFELWDNQPVPLLWETNSRPMTTPAYDPYVVRRDTSRYSGSYAAMLYANNVFKPYAKSTFSVSTHPAALSFFYKLSFAPCVNDPGYMQQDTVSVLIELINNGATVDSGYWESTATSFTYSRLIIPVSHQAASFDSCRITIMGGRVDGGCGIVAAPTEFWVDHLQLLDSTATGCADTGVVVDGVECPLISDFATGTLLHPCSMPSGAALHVGDTITYTYGLGSCISICMQGTDVAISCFQVLHPAQIPARPCHAYYAWSKHIDTVSFYNQSGADSVTGYHWDFGDGSSSTDANPTHTYARDSDYIVCLHMTGLDYAGAPCSDTYCDTIHITHDCVDSTLLCPVAPGAICCDLSPPDTVCGCDSVTYFNACYAASVGGIARYYHGPCVSTRNGIHDVADEIAAISLAPVPAQEELQLSWQTLRAGTISVRLLSTIGQELRTIDTGTQDAGTHKLRLDLAGLSAGVYLIEIRSGTYTKTRRFVKE
ncbi:MAG: T9SS type A sorting domain-containing protein [Bacteroidetes bacterium]|nr:T9SS type A sorting domain-containing protein [Bacteroidota bacterium]